MPARKIQDDNVRSTAQSEITNMKHIVSKCRDAPLLATDSRRAETSRRLAKRKLALLDRESREPKALSDIRQLEIRMLSDDLGVRHAIRHHRHNGRNREPKITNARQTTHAARVHCDPVERHVHKVPGLAARDLEEWRCGRANQRQSACVAARRSPTSSSPRHKQQARLADRKEHRVTHYWRSQRVRGPIRRFGNVSLALTQGCAPVTQHPLTASSRPEHLCVAVVPPECPVTPATQTSENLLRVRTHAPKQWYED